MLASRIENPCLAPVDSHFPAITEPLLVVTGSLLASRRSRCAEEGNVTDVIVLAYSLGWVLTSVGLVVASHRVRSDVRPVPDAVVVSLVAGGAWPLLLVGAVQFGLLVALINGFERWTRRSQGNGAADSQDAAAPDSAELVADAV
jgi:hypothetical protein